MKSARSLSFLAFTLAGAWSLSTLVACGDDDDDTPITPPPGTSGSGNTGGVGGAPNPGGSGGQANQPGTFDVTISGEDLALEGYTFEPANASIEGDPPAFVDGWTIKFDHVLVTVGNVRLNAGPETNPSDPKQIGAQVATAAGPWAVDLASAGPVTDKGSGQPGAWPLATLTGNFAADTRYAFSYDTVAAAAAATRVGFKAGSEELYQQAVANGWAMVFQGTATFVGNGTPVVPPFDAFSKPVNFTLGLANRASYVNCANPELGGGEDPPRGVQTLANQATTVQITIHTDHLFWDTLDVEGTPLHFDHIASQALFNAAAPTAPGVVANADLANAPVNGLTVRSAPETPLLPARSYVDDYTPAPGNFALTTGASGITTLLDFIEYSQQSGGHMNADGECAVVAP